MGARRARGGTLRSAGALAAAALLVALAAGTASASTGTQPGADRAAAVQSVLDRVLGPGNATVAVLDTVRTSATSTTSVRWGSAVPGAGTSTRTVTGAGTTTQVVVQNAVGGTATTLATPAGALVHQTVAVAVDRAHLGGVRIPALRRLVASAAGVVSSRGDRLSLVVARFARPAPPSVPQPSLLALLLPGAVPALWGLGGMLALLVLVVGVRGLRGRSGARA